MLRLSLANLRPLLHRRRFEDAMAEEVAAASGMTGHPIPFVRAEPEGRRVLEGIRGGAAGSA